MLAEAVKTTRKEQDLTQEAFASCLCEWLPGINLTKQAVSNWERGAYLPDELFLVSVAIAYSDWRKTFALECLAALRPEIWGDDHKMEGLDADAEME